MHLWADISDKSFFPSVCWLNMLWANVFFSMFPFEGDAPSPGANRTFSGGFEWKFRCEKVIKTHWILLTMLMHLSCVHLDHLTLNTWIDWSELNVFIKPPNFCNSTEDEMWKPALFFFFKLHVDFHQIEHLNQTLTLSSIWKPSLCSSLLWLPRCCQQLVWTNTCCFSQGFTACFICWLFQAYVQQWDQTKHRFISLGIHLQISALKSCKLCPNNENGPFY